MAKTQQSRKTSLVDKRYHQVMQQCANEMPKRFSQLLSTQFFASVNDELLDRSEKAGNNELRNRYMEAMHELRTKRSEIEKTFHRTLWEGFNNFVKGNTRAGVGTNVDQPLKSKLSLVETNDYERGLLMNNIVNNACSHYLRALFGLNRRLAIINGGTKVGEKSAALPTGPRHLCDAFAHSMEGVELEHYIGLDLIMLFDRTVVRGAGEIYEDFNQHLSQAGLLPDLLDEEDLISQEGYRPFSSGDEPKAHIPEPKPAEPEPSTKQPESKVYQVVVPLNQAATNSYLITHELQPTLDTLLASGVFLQRHSQSEASFHGVQSVC